MTVSLLFLLGRFLLAVPLVVLGVERIRTGTTAGRVLATVGVAATACVVLGAWGDAAAVVLAGSVIASVALTDPAPSADDVVVGVGLVGACVVVAACYVAVGAALDLTLTAPLWDLDLR